MSNTINLIVELGPESMGKLDKILAALEGIGHHNCASCTDSALKVMGENLRIVTGTAEEPKAPEQPAENPAQEISQPVEEVTAAADPEPAEEQKAPEYTKNDVLALVQKLAAPNNPKREAAKAIVKSYGAKVSDIPADKYGEVMEKLHKLTAEG